MRRARRATPVLVGALASATVALVLQPLSTQAAPSPDELTPGMVRQLAAGLQIAPKAPAEALAAGRAAPLGPNPYLALLPDQTQVDYQAWRARLQTQGRQRAEQRALRQARPSPAAAPQPILYDELEPETLNGLNDALASAEVIDGFGTRNRQNARARILGDLTNTVPTTPTLAPEPEDDGSIPLAQDTGIEQVRLGATVSAVRGDGPHASATAGGDGTGDFDFYALDLTAGRTLTAAVDTPTGDLDPVAVLYDATGEIVAVNDDRAPFVLDSLLQFDVTVSGSYFLMVSGYSPFAVLPADPFDSASGDDAGSEGPYDLVITSGIADRDVYAVDLRAGDVVSGSVVDGATRLQLFDPAGVERQGSTQDLSFIYPPDSPLPGGGNAVAAHVAAVDGRHYLAVSSGAGGYDVSFEVYRAGLQGEGRRAVQTLFLDFDGARVNTAVFGGPGVRELTGLRGFLGGWGLGADDEDALIDAIVATVQENVRADLEASGLNDRFAVRILNSRDDADPFGQRNVSRLVVGGTIAESGIETIGIAQSIDPGNFGHEETALVLLDLLSEPGDAPYSLNAYLTPETEDRIGFVGQAVGNVTSHEAGHFLGSFHTDQFDETANLMDQGGNFPVLFGVGPDGVGGTADDVDVDFGEDVYVPSEGLTGIEDTLANTAFGLTGGARAALG